jgi:hypothetical protein
MIWLHLRSLMSPKSSVLAGRRLIWIFVAISVCGTLVVEIPFVLRMGNYAHMAIARQLSAIAAGLGPLLVCGAILILRNRNLSSIRADFVGLNGAYLANATLCLLFYAPMRQSGWTLTLLLGCFMVLEIVWILFSSFKTPPSIEHSSNATKLDPLTVASQ